MNPGGRNGRGQQQTLPPAPPPTRENRGLDLYCIRCNQNFKTPVEKAEHDRILHGR